MHPSGPKLPGHPSCGKGMIYDHAAGKCIPLTKKPKKKKDQFDPKNIWR